MTEQNRPEMGEVTPSRFERVLQLLDSPNMDADAWRMALAEVDAAIARERAPDSEGLRMALSEAEGATGDAARLTAYEKLREELTKRQPLKATVWGENDVIPPQRWVLDGWIPAEGLTILAGRGGIGKSHLALQIAAGVASGGMGEGQWIDDRSDVGPALGVDIRDAGVPTIYASWEDDAMQMKRWLSAMSHSHAAPHVRPAKLQRLHLLDMIGRGVTWGPKPGSHTSTVASLRPTGRQLRAFAEDRGARFVVLDSLAAVWQGNENDRTLVRAFLADWDAWGRHVGAAVFILGHEAKSREAGVAGSTDFEAGPRAVWTLREEKRGEKPSELRFQLACAKLNYEDKPPPLLLDKVIGPGMRWSVGGMWADSDAGGGGLVNDYDLEDAR